MQLRPIDQPDGPKNELNYYHCVVSGLPFDLPMNHIVELISPNGEEAKELVALREQCHYILVPHQLHVFKEKLSKKFAMVTYFLQPVPPRCSSTTSEGAGGSSSSSVCDAPSSAPSLLIENKNTIGALSEEERAAILKRRKKAHELVVSYFTTEGSHSLALTPPEPGTASAAMIAASEKAMKEVVFQFCQPKNMHNALDFLTSLDNAVELLKKDQCTDVKKLRTWMLTKAVLSSSFSGNENGEVENAFVESNADGSVKAPSASTASRHYGSICSGAIGAEEWAWLRTQHREFPKVASTDSITAFFVKSFHPYFTYKDTVVV